MVNLSCTSLSGQYQVVNTTVDLGIEAKPHAKLSSLFANPAFYER